MHRRGRTGNSRLGKDALGFLQPGPRVSSLHRAPISGRANQAVRLLAAGLIGNIAS